MKSQKFLQQKMCIKYFHYYLLIAALLFLPQEMFSSPLNKVTLSQTNTTLRAAFEAIERQTNLSVDYEESRIDVSKRVNISVSGVEVSEALSLLLKNSGYTYAIKDNHIIISLEKQQDSRIRITGTVTDVNGEPIIGANVVEKGTTNGVITDLDGKFTLDVKERAVLSVSYIGYTPLEVTPGPQRTLSIRMSEDTQALDEVVVVGYGTQKKVNMTGSVVSVDMNKMAESRPITNLSVGLSGLAAGVTVTQTNGGRPGADGASIRIRGQGTLNNSDPLIIIDGVEGDMSYINPQDVESISVLKDAASSAIYGSRAANGVILITTKKGQEGQAHISYHGYMTSETLANRVNMVTNYADYMELVNESATNSDPNASKPYSQGKIDEWRNAGNSDPVKYPNNDWQDYVFKRGLMQNHTLSVHGGSAKTRYFMSGNYLENPGIMDNTGFNRISARVNLDVDVMPWFKVGVNSYGSKGVTEVGGLPDQTRHTTPGIVYRAPDGRFGGVNNPEDGIGAGANNPLRIINSAKGDTTTTKLFSKFFVQLNPLKGLTVDGSFTYDFTDNYGYSQPVFHDVWDFYTNTVQTIGTGTTSVNNSNKKTVRQQMDGIIRYETNVSHLNIQMMAGASQESYRYKWFAASKTNLTSPELTELNAATTSATATGNYTNWAMRSYFGRLNLNWAEKYLFEANLRMDYSSRFAPGKTRRGIFPSFSAGWRISEEDFLRNLSWLNSLKLRASWGGLGNNSIGNYDYLALYSADNYVLNGTPVIGFAQKALANSAVSWETTYVSNIGIDFGLLNNKLNGSADFFVKNTKDILMSLPVPLVHGSATIPPVNFGEVRNTGIELILSWNDKIGEVGYFVGGNFSYVKNKITKFRGDVPVINGQNLLLEGEPINVQYVMKVDRLVQTAEDLAVVQAMVDKNPDAFKSYRRPQLGDFLYADTNGDGILTSDDRIKVGNGTNPPVTYGLNFGVNWKGFDISCLIQGVSGLLVYWNGNDAPRFRPNSRAGSQLNKTLTDGRWYEGRPDKATYPRLINYDDDRNSLASDFWVEDKSYFRVKNIQLGYTAPKKISQKILLETLRIYVSVDNALTLTDYRGLDPEENDISKYPTFRMTTIGVNLNF